MSRSNAKSTTSLAIMAEEDDTLSPFDVLEDPCAVARLFLFPDDQLQVEYSDWYCRLWIYYNIIVPYLEIRSALQDFHRSRAHVAGHDEFGPRQASGKRTSCIIEVDQTCYHS
jgi:hypothetical protein